MKAADYALLITKGLNAELVAIHVVRSEDALIATNSLIEDLETVTTEDSLLQKVKKDVQKWFNAIKDELRVQVERAAAACPVQAISIGQQVNDQKSSGLKGGHLSYIDKRSEENLISIFPMIFL